MVNEKNILMSLNLQLFADGGAGSVGGAGESGATGENATAAVSQTTGENSASLNGGETSPAAEVGNPIKDRQSEYEAFLKEFKDLDDARVQSILKNRLRGTKESADKYTALTPTLELLYKKYGVRPGDIIGLNKAIDEDDSYYEQEALEKGISVEQLKAVRKVEKENASLRREKEARNRRDSANRIYTGWMQQAKAVKTIYPSFDFRTELKNPKFGELLKSNIDVRTAYEVIHNEEIIASAMKHAADTVEQKISNNIMAGGFRPSENGNSSQGAATARLDPSNMSKAERAELNRRVLRGEKVRFV